MFYINGKFLSQKITGVQRFALEIVSRLNTTTHEYTILAPKNIIEDEAFSSLNIRVIGQLTGSLWEQIDLPWYLNSIGNPLLVNLCNTAPVFYKNQVVTIHDLAFMFNPKWFSKQFVLWYKFLIPSLVKRSRKIITVSSFSKQELIRLLNVDSSKIVVVNNAASPIKKTSKSRSDYKNFILFVGSMDPRKNLQTLLSAFSVCNIPDLKLIIVGDVNSNFKQVEIADSPDIIRLGRVSDEVLSQLYTNAMVFVYPSYYEGFGIPPLEAMAHSCPVICSNTSSLPEVCGQAALYFSPDRVNELANVIKSIVNEPELRAELIKRGQERVNFYSWEKSASSVIEIVNNLS